MFKDYVQKVAERARVLLTEGIAFVIRDAVEVCVLASVYQDEHFRALVIKGLSLGSKEECEVCENRESCAQSVWRQPTSRAN